jgi:Trk K+ transport system NAD-binding subunit
MRKALFAVLIAAAGLMVIGVIVFRYSLELSWIDSIYFVITTVTTVGYGDISLKEAPDIVKIFGNVLMIVGAASMAASFGIITDYLLKVHLQEIFGRRRKKMKNHMVLCGLGNVGFRVLEQLRKLDKEIVVVEKNEDCSFLSSARSLGAKVILGDIRLNETLEQANIKDAICLIAVSDEDLANLEAVMNAREINKDIRVVLRMFDQNLANKVQNSFNIETAFSTSALAAPAVAMAAVDPAVISSFYVGDDLMLNLQLEIQEGSSLASMTVAQLEEKGGVSVITHESAKTKKRSFHPSDPLQLEAGDKIVVTIKK